MSDDILQAQRALLNRVHTEGVQAAYEAALTVCRDPKAPAPARATAAATLFRVAGYFDQKDRSNTKEPHEMSADELQAEISKLQATTAVGKSKSGLPDIFE